MKKKRQSRVPNSLIPISRDFSFSRKGPWVGNIDEWFKMRSMQERGLDRENMACDVLDHLVQREGYQDDFMVRRTYSFSGHDTIDKIDIALCYSDESIVVPIQIKHNRRARKKFLSRQKTINGSVSVACLAIPHDRGFRRLVKDMYEEINQFVFRQGDYAKQ